LRSGHSLIPHHLSCKGGCLLLSDRGSCLLLGCHLPLNPLAILLAALNLSHDEVRGVAPHRLLGFLQ
jgi:hypothetical protein